MSPRMEFLYKSGTIIGVETGEGLGQKSSGESPYRSEALLARPRRGPIRREAPPDGGVDDWRPFCWEAPLTESHLAKAHLEEAPLEEAPLEEAPLVEVPSTKAPLTKAPLTKAPVVETLWWRPLLWRPF